MSYVPPGKRENYVPPQKRPNDVQFQGTYQTPGGETSPTRTSVPEKIKEMIVFWEIHNGTVKEASQGRDLHYYMQCGWEPENLKNAKRKEEAFLHHVHLMYITRDRKWYYNIKDCGDKDCSPGISRIPKTSRRNVPINYGKQNYSEVGCVDEIWNKLKCKTDESSYINGKLLYIVQEWSRKRGTVSFDKLAEEMYQYILYCDNVARENMASYTGKKIILKGKRTTGWYVEYPDGSRERLDLRKNEINLFSELNERCRK